jgi:trigger factor
MTIDASQLQVSVQEQERWRRVMNVTVPASIVQMEEQKAAQKLASRAKMKGFRKGRVPAKLIESRYAGTLRKEALDKLIGSAYRHALVSEDLKPISEGEIEDIQYRPAQDLTFAIAFDVEPVIEVQRLGGFAVERKVPQVTEEQVQDVLARIQEQNGVWRPEDEGEPADGHLVSVKILKLDGEAEPEGEARDYDFVLGQGDAIPDIEEAIKTLEAGASGEFEVAFPDDFPDEQRRGEVERVHISLESRRVLDVPELDDDLARQVGDFETLAELESKIREDMQEEAKQAADSGVRARLLDLLIEANPFEVPGSMVDRYARAVIGDQAVPEDRRAELRERLHPEAERAVKRILMIDRIAETQGLAATEDELEERVEEIAEANDTDPAKVYAELQKTGRLESIERDLTEKKVFNFLKEQSEIIDAPDA